MSKKKLPRKIRGIHYRGDSLVVVFALADGTIEHRSLGPVNIDYAKQQREIFKREVAEGRYQKAAPKIAIPKVSTVGSLWPVYLNTYRNNGGRNAGRQEIAWNHLKPTFGAVPISEISTAKIVSYIEARRALGRANGTINRELSTLQAMFRLGTKSTGTGGKPIVDRMPAFPCKLAEGEPRQGFIKDPQYETLVANAKSPWMRAFIECAYTFGFRKGELLNLRVGAVDLLDRWIRSSGADTKTGAPRKVKMTTKVYDALCACVRGKGNEDFVFTYENGSRVVDPRQDWYDLCVASKLGSWIPAKRNNGEDYEKYSGFNIHDFRRSAIRNMKRRGISDTVAMKISGHSTRSVFDRYNITDEHDLEQASLLIESRGQAAKSKAKTGTKTDTLSYAHS